MRTLVLAVTLALFGLTSAASIAAEGNHFIKGTKSYQKSTPSSETVSQDDAAQASVTSENPQDISPAAGAEEDSKPTTKEVLQESMKLPRK